MGDASEEHYILRVKPPELAAKLRAWLREAQGLQGRAELQFPECNRRGELTVEGVAYPVSLEDLPTRVESCKTLDDANLVKMGDVGQVLVVHPPGTALPPPPPRDQEARAAPAALAATEAPDGVTPPMRRARARQFRPRFTIAREAVAAYQDCMLDILQGRAPEGWYFRDIEEEYRVDPTTGEGRWVQVGAARRFGRGGRGGGGGDGGGGGGGGGRGRGRGRGRRRQDSDDEDLDFEEDMSDDE